MKWVKIPKENHALFLDAIPNDPRIGPPINMFGGLAAKVNGHMAMGLWAKSVMVRVGQKDHDEALAMGAVEFDPMGRGAHDTAVVLPDDYIGRTEDLRDWMKRAVEYCMTLPPKEKGAKPAKSATKSAKAAPKKAVSSTKAAKAKPRASAENAGKAAKAKPRASAKNAAKAAKAKPRASAKNAAKAAKASKRSPPKKSAKRRKRSELDGLNHNFD